MKFVKKIGSDNKTVSVYLDLEGLDIPVPDALKEHGLEDLKHFRISTYQSLGANRGEAEWEVVFGATHAIINGFTDDQRREYACMLIYMHYLIRSVMGNSEPLEGRAMLELEDQLAALLDKFDRIVDLYPKLIQYTEEHIDIQSFERVGERPQDSVAMTFYRDDVVELTAVGLLCKMLTPIFGVFIEYTRNRLDNSLKDSHCVAILKTVLDRRCARLVKKLDYFITRIAKQILGKLNLSHWYHGYTAGTIGFNIYSAILVRRFVVVDLFRKEGNLITYVTSCIRSVAKSQSSGGGGSNKMAVSPLIPPTDRGGSDDGNLSGLESESRSSTKTADYLFLVKAAVHELKPRFILENELDESLIDQAIAYYSVNPIALTPINSYILGTLFGPYMCGAKSIEAVHSDALAILVPIAQAYFIQQGYQDLVHAISANPTGQMRAVFPGSASQLRATWNSSFDYQNCNRKFTWIVSDLRWDTGLEKMVSTITEERYTYNTAPGIWEVMHQPSLNGSELSVPENLAAVTCHLIMQLYP